MTLQVNARVFALAVIPTLVLAACHSQEPLTSSSSNWAKCENVKECSSIEHAVACVEGYCVDPNGNHFSSKAAVVSAKVKNGSSVQIPDSGGPATLDAGPSPEAPPIDTDAGVFGPDGVIITIAGSEVDGTYELTESSSCDGTFLYQMTGASTGVGKVDLVITGVEPSQGASATTPDVQVRLTFKSPEDGVYPANGYGTCSMMGQLGTWTNVGVSFACSGLIGLGSKKPFSLAGRANCIDNNPAPMIPNFPPLPNN